MIYVLQLPVSFIIPTGRSTKPKLRGRSWHIGWQTIAVGQPAAMLWHCRVMLFPIRLFLFHHFSKEGKVAVMLSSAARHKDVVITSALDVRWSFTPQHLNRRGQCPLVPTGYEGGWPPSHASNAVVKRKTYCAGNQSPIDPPVVHCVATEPSRIFLAVHSKKWYCGNFWPLPRMRDLRFSLILKMAALRYSETPVAI